jgi:hypothetical protein
MMPGLYKLTTAGLLRRKQEIASLLPTCEPPAVATPTNDSSEIIVQSMMAPTPSSVIQAKLVGMSPMRAVSLLGNYICFPW